MKIAAALTSLLLWTVAVPAHAQISGGDFEQQGARSTSNYCYFGADTAGGGACGGAGWTGGAGGGLQVKTNLAWPGVNTPDGDYYAFLQNEGFITQVLDLSAGVYSLDWLAAGRSSGCCGGDQRYDVLLDDAVLFSGSTRSGQAFSTVLSNPFTVAVGGSHRLTFQGLNSVGDQTAFIDRVSLSPALTVSAPVPEPASWAMLIGGFGVIGHTLRRRRGETGRALTA